ncbi:MAG: Alginate biosynthesis protein AlgA [Chlamydiia bacterium]|nr:Alginate biosynthesis protein AlgA [Chlamydiia bacterium]
MKIIVLAGGSGSRLWPFIKEGMPKCLLQFSDGESLLEMTLKRYIDNGYSDDIFIITDSKSAQSIQEHLSHIAPNLVSRVLVEPYSKGTAPAISWAIRHLLVTNKAKKSDPILTVPCDHYMTKNDVFIELLQKSVNKLQDDKIIAFGVKPTKPETGFGYIRTTEEEGFLHKVNSFIEKPDIALAEKFSKNEDWLWNTGIYLFKINTMLNEFEEHIPSIAHFMKVESHHEDYVYRSLTEVSIDHAVMEKTSRLNVVKLEKLEWLDMGSWDNIYELLPKDENGNVKVGKIVEMGTKNCLIFGGKRVVSTVGVEDLLIIDTEEGIFVSKRHESQKVKDLMNKLQNSEIESS